MLEARDGVYGIAPFLQEDVDRSLLFGATPGQILKDLNKKCIRMAIFQRHSSSIIGSRTFRGDLGMDGRLKPKEC